ncbi:SpoIIE family protein phosphatase [Odoribacter laneus]|uniref:SpoIIE family protein phosphatase n=1 Tax=Odoribacter laneus TaxID=626933 RepID=UPI003AF5EB34
MKKYTYRSFSQKLILYLLIAMLCIFSLVFVCLYASAKNFTHTYISHEMNGLASNICRTLKRKIDEIEQIPQLTFGKEEINDSTNFDHFLSRMINTYPFLTQISLHHNNRTYCKSKGSVSHDIAENNANLSADTKQILYKNSREGYWYIKSRNAGNTVLCYCEPLPSSLKPNKPGHLELNFYLKHLTNFIQDIKPSPSGYIFITDQEGNFLIHPKSEVIRYGNLFHYLKEKHIKYCDKIKNYITAGTGNSYLTKENTRYCMYYHTDSIFHWKINSICPCEEIQSTSDKFCLLFLFIFCIGFFTLLGIIIWIVRHSLFPLGEFTKNVHNICNGKRNLLFPTNPHNKELQELYESFAYMQNNITSYIKELKKTTAENEKITTEINLARKIQKRFLPKPIDLPPNIELYGELKQSKSVGGDLYEYFLIDNRLYFAIGDVSGKGVPAALYMASIIKLFRYVASRQNSTAEICNTINAHMCDNNEDDMYVTMAIGIMDINTGVITFTNAGHPRPLIIHQNGQIHTLNKYTDVPIGILEDYKFSEFTYTLRQGCQILLFTDGITDAENNNGNFFGQGRLMECIQQVTDRSPQFIVSSILKGIHSHIKDAGQSDDFTILSILYNGIPN